MSQEQNLIGKHPSRFWAVLTACVLSAIVSTAVCLLAVVPIFSRTRDMAELQEENKTLRARLVISKRNMAALKKEHKRIKEELANAEYVIANHIKLRHHHNFIPSGVPEVHTKVVDVRQKTGEVALGAGKDSGIKEGFIFLIHRGNQYVGKVRVTRVWDSFSGGVILDSKKPIRTGDEAMTDTAPDP